MEPLKFIHVTSVLLSISGFAIRGIWMLQNSSKLKFKWVRITPHIIDTVLLASAIGLVVEKQFAMSSPWLQAKIAALLVYIFFGFVAFRLGKTQKIKTVAFFSAIIVFVYIILVAINKTPFLFV